MGTNLQAFYKHFYIGRLKTQKQQLHFVKIKIKILINFCFLFWLGACKSGRAQASTGRPHVSVEGATFNLILTHTDLAVERDAAGEGGDLPDHHGDVPHGGHPPR